MSFLVLLNDGQILTYIQSYDCTTQKLLSLTDKSTGVVTGPTFYKSAADHSPDAEMVSVKASIVFQLVTSGDNLTTNAPW